jgi:hypothetical protein
MAETTIITCTCKSEYQDKLYGKGKRVANVKRAGVGFTGGCVCTVCGKSK